MIKNQHAKSLIKVVNFSIDTLNIDEDMGDKQLYNKTVIFNIYYIMFTIKIKYIYIILD